MVDRCIQVNHNTEHSLFVVFPPLSLILLVCFSRHQLFTCVSAFINYLFVVFQPSSILLLVCCSLYQLFTCCVSAFINYLFVAFPPSSIIYVLCFAFINYFLLCFSLPQLFCCCVTACSQPCLGTTSTRELRCVRVCVRNITFHTTRNP